MLFGLGLFLLVTGLCATPYVVKPYRKNLDWMEWTLLVWMFVGVASFSTSILILCLRYLP